MAAIQEVKQAKELSESALLDKSNVVGVGYGYREVYWGW